MMISTAVGNGQALLVGKGHHLKKPELVMVITLRSSLLLSNSLPTEREKVSHAYGARYRLVVVIT